jgi:hypothetical protein
LEGAHHDKGCGLVIAVEAAQIGVDIKDALSVQVNGDIDPVLRQIVVDGYDPSATIENVISNF